MTGKTALKITADCLMTVILLLLMAYSLIGEAAHEWLGTGMLLLVVLHHILNWGWHKNIRKGRYSAFRILQTSLTTLLLFTMLGSLISGILLSRYVFDFLPFRDGRALARMLHLPCTYWCFVLMSLHLGLHWSMVLGMIRRMAGAPSRIQTAALRLPALLIAVYGVIAFFRNDILSYLLLQTHFVFFNFDQPLILFFMDYLAMMGLFVFLAHYVGRFLRASKPKT